MGTERHVYLVPDGGEVTRRRALLPPGTLIEAWPDRDATGLVWVTADAKQLLDGAGEPLPVALAIDASRVAVYYGPRVSDIGSLPAEDSVRARVLSQRGIAAAWVTLDEHGRLTQATPSPADPVFFLRRPRGELAHRWRLFRTCEEACAYMDESYGTDPEAQMWARALPVADWEELISASGGPSTRASDG
jgi:hypothetical protein